MPVTTVSQNQFVRGASGRPILVANSNTHNSLHKRYTKIYKCRATQLIPRLDLVTTGSPVALDCEGVLLPRNTSLRKRGLGRCSIVHVQGQVVFDAFVHYPDNIEHRPLPQHLRLGVTYNDIRPKNGAQPHAQVLEAAKAIFDKSGFVIAHSAIDHERMVFCFCA